MSTAVSTAMSISNLRPRAFLINKAMQLFGPRTQTEELTGIDKDTLDKCANEKNDREFTVRDMIVFIQKLGSLGNPALDVVIDELSRWFIAPGRQIVTTELVAYMGSGVEAMKNGGRLNGHNGHSGYCPDCLAKLQPYGVNKFVRMFACMNPQCLAE